MVREISLTGPDGQTRTVPLDRDRISVGRAPENDLPFPEDIGLSRHHLLFERYGEDWLVRDLLSKNGTYVNTSRLSEPVKLRAGDRVTASRLTMVYDPKGTSAPVLVDAVPQGLTFATNLHKAMSSGSGSAAKAAGAWKSPVEALVRAGRELAGRRPLGELFKILLDLALEAANAQRGVLITTENGEDTIQAQRGSNFRISRTVRDRVLESKDSVLIHDALTDAAYSGSKSIVIQGVRSFMAAPLQTEERVIGLIYVDLPQAGREFNTDDLNLLTVMANVAAIRIERERLMEIEQMERVHSRELEQAAEIQARLLPDAPPDVPWLKVAGYNLACHTVGGDYYDYLCYPDGRIGVVVADVAGKGLPAALMMSNLQAKVQAFGETGLSPAEFVNRLNRSMAKTCPGNRFVTFFLGVADPNTSELVYCNAGHNPPLLVRATGEVVHLEPGGCPVAMFSFMQYSESRCEFAPGDLLVMYSDGVTEAANGAGEDFGEERLLAAVAGAPDRTAEGIVEAIHTAVRSFAAGQPQADDITAVVAMRCGG